MTLNIPAAIATMLIASVAAHAWAWRRQRRATARIAALEAALRDERRARYLDRSRIFAAGKAFGRDEQDAVWQAKPLYQEGLARGLAEGRDIAAEMRMVCHSGELLERTV